MLCVRYDHEKPVSVYWCRGCACVRVPVDYFGTGRRRRSGFCGDVGRVVVLAGFCVPYRALAVLPILLPVCLQRRAR